MTTSTAQPVTAIIGHEDEPAIAELLHELDHHGAVDVVRIDPVDLDRRRLRVVSEAGSDLAIMLPRNMSLRDGAVLVLDRQRALIVRSGPVNRMRIRARTTAAALRLGFLAGHLHWKCDQNGDTLTVVIPGSARDHLNRIESLLGSGDLEMLDAPSR